MEGLSIWLPLVLTLNIICGILGITGFILGLTAYINIKAFEKSTHTVTYAPMDEEVKKQAESWATQPETLEKERKAYREDLEDEMPEMAPDDEDTKIFSF